MFFFGRSGVVAAVGLLACAASALAVPLEQNQLPLQQRSTVSFASKKAKEFHVGTNLPGIPFEVSESWAGNLPISSRPHESRELFFWFWPSLFEEGKDDVVIWLNGGPGCSSLEGMLQENGPFKLPYSFNGTYAVYNEYSLTNLSNVLWVEQPVGVGFTKGSPDIKDEPELAKEFVGFLDQFYETFKELKGKRLWLTGESYAGKYIPFIANEIYSRSDKKNEAAGLDLQGFSINDPSFTGNYFGEELPAVEFAVQHQKTLGLNDTFIEKLKKDARMNGIENYVEKHLTYPPKGIMHLPAEYQRGKYYPWDDVYTAAYEVNPCFNVYKITDQCPSPPDPLGFPGDATNPSADNFLNNQTGFKEAIHVDPNITWLECTNGKVFTGPKGTGDESKSPAVTILPSVIEKSKKSIIQHGLLDFVLIANGSALGIQNMTWGAPHAKQGFQTKPNSTFIVDGKEAGTYHEERGLTFVLVENAGHMIPQDLPKTAYKISQYLLGRVPSLGA